MSTNYSNSRKHQSQQKRAIRNQIDHHLANETLLAELSNSTQKPWVEETLQLLLGCGSMAAETVRIRRGIDLRGRAYGVISGVNDCLNPECVYCGPMLVRRELSKLDSRIVGLSKSGAIDGCITYSGAITCQHRKGDSIEGLIRLQRDAEASFRESPTAKGLIEGWICSPECTTGRVHGNGAHPHTQFAYTLRGLDTQLHQRMWEAKEQHFKAHFSRHSPQLIGEARQVSWRPGWVSPQGSGVSGFFRPGGPERWDLTNETINGIAKNGGIASAMMGEEYAEFTMALQGKKWLSLGGCFDTTGKESMHQCEFDVAIIEKDNWDRLAPRTQRVLKTVAMSPEYWKTEEVRVYADLANQPGFALRIDEQIQRKFDGDCLSIPGIAVKVAPTFIW